MVSAIRVLCVAPDGGIDASEDDLAVDRVREWDDALQRLRDRPVDCVVIDGGARDGSGIDLLGEIREGHPDLPAILCDPAGDPETAAAATRRDVTEYLPAPVDTDRLAERIRAAVRTGDDGNRYRRMLESVGDGLYALDRDGRFKAVNEALLSMTGHDRAELLGEHVSVVLDDPDHERGRRLVRELVEGERSGAATYEAPVEGADGERIPCEITLTLDGTPDSFRGTVGVVRDVSERRDRELERQRYETIVETAPVGAFMLDDEGTILDHDDRAVEMVGRPGEDMTGEPFPTLVADGVVSPEAIEKYLDAVRDLLSSSTDAETATFDVEVDLDGERRYYEAHVGLLPFDEEFRGTAGILHDVTDRHRREEQLREERAFIEGVLDALPDVFYVLDEAGRFQRWNDRLVEVTGYDPDELDGMDALELVPEADRPEIASAMAAVYEEGAVETRETELVTADGRRIPYRLNGSRLTDEDGEVIGLAGIGRDVTEQRARERRLSVLGRVLRHNLRNEMTVVAGIAADLADRMTDAEAREDLETVRAAAERLVELGDTARRIEDVIEAGTPDGTVDPAAVARDVVASWRTSASDATVRVTADTDREVRGDGRLRLAIDAVVENAIEHAGPAPTVEVRVREAGDGQVAIAVADDGPGIGEEERVVVETDEVTQLRHGSGLGLWLVRTVAETFGGELAIEDRDADGTVVTLRLPTA